MAKTKKIDWLNHVLEFAVVIIGILIAFQLNTCRDDNNERLLVEKHIDNIIEETKLNKKLFNASIENTQNLKANLDTLQSYLSSNAKTPEEINPIVFRALNLGYLYIKKTAYNSLKNSNDIRFINDFQLQNDLVNLYENYTWTEGMQIQNFKGYDERFFNYFIENFDLTENNVQPLVKYKSLEFKNIIAAYKHAISQRITREKSNLNLINSFLETYDTAKQ